MRYFFIILAVGVCLAALLLAVFLKAGKKTRRQSFTDRELVHNLGDEGLIRLYEQAETDNEREGIIEFVKEKLAQETGNPSSFDIMPAGALSAQGPAQPEAVSRTMPGTMTQTMPETTAQTMPGYMEQMTQNTAAQTAPNTAATIPDTVAQIIPETAAQISPEYMEQMTPKMAAQTTPDTVAQMSPNTVATMPETVTQIMPQTIPDTVTRTMPEAVAQTLVQASPTTPEQTIMQDLPKAAAEMPEQKQFSLPKNERRQIAAMLTAMSGDTAEDNSIRTIHTQTHELPLDKVDWAAIEEALEKKREEDARIMAHNKLIQDVFSKIQSVENRVMGEMQEDKSK